MNRSLSALLVATVIGIHPIIGFAQSEVGQPSSPPGAEQQQQQQEGAQAPHPVQQQGQVKQPGQEVQQQPRTQQQGQAPQQQQSGQQQKQQDQCCQHQHQHQHEHQQQQSAREKYQPPSPEQRVKMAEMHEKLAICLRSSRPIDECKQEMMQSCHSMKGGCPMMGGKGHM